MAFTGDGRCLEAHFVFTQKIHRSLTYLIGAGFQLKIETAPSYDIFDAEDIKLCHYSSFFMWNNNE